MPVISSGVPISSASPFTIFSDGPGGVTRQEFDHSVALSGLDTYTYFENQARLQAERENNQIINYEDTKAAKLSVALIFLGILLLIFEVCKTLMELFLYIAGAGYWGGLVYGISGFIGYLSYRHKTYRLVLWTVWTSIICLVVSLVIFGIEVAAFSTGNDDGRLRKPFIHVIMLILALFGSICSLLLVECGRTIVFGKKPPTTESCSSIGDRTAY